MAVKGYALLLLPLLLEEACADWTTTIKTRLIVPNTLAPVVDYCTTQITPSTLVTRTAVPSSFDHARSHEEQFTSIVTVPDGKSPTIHFSPILSTGCSEPCAPATSSDTSTEASTTENTAPGVVPVPVVPTGSSTEDHSSTTQLSSTGIISSGSTGQGTSSIVLSSTPIAPASMESSTPSSTEQGTSSMVPSSTHVPPAPAGYPPGSTGQSNSSAKPSSTPATPASTESAPPISTGQDTSTVPSSTYVPSTSPSSTSPGTSPTAPTSTPISPASTGSSPATSSPVPGTTSTTAAAQTSSGVVSSSSTLPSQQSTSSGILDSHTSAPGGSMSSWASSDQLSSVDLASAPNLQSLSPGATGSDTAIGIYAPTKAPSSEPWATSTITVSSGTITQAPTATNTDVVIIGALLKNSYNNIEDLKKDPKSYKEHIRDIRDKATNYLSKINFDSSKSPCSNSRKRDLGKRTDIFNAVSSLASQAAGATADTAKDILGAAISCVEPLAVKIESIIPEKPGDVTNEVENQVKKGTTYFDELSGIVGTVEGTVNGEGSQISSESSTSCKSSTTFSDCTWSTIVSSAPGSTTASMSTTSTEICTTRTACSADPTTFSTVTTIGWCRPRSYTDTFIVPDPVPITPTDYTAAATPGAAGGIPLASSVSSTAPPDQESATATAESSNLAPGGASVGFGTATKTPTATTPGPSCQALYHAVQKDNYSYCQFDCDAYTGKYPVASSTPGMSNYDPCPYSKPPSSSWSPSNAGAFTTTVADGTVYYCGNSGYENFGVNKDAKSCVTPMSSITVIPSIHSAWSASQVSAASASRASASSAIAAAATPTDQVYIVYDSNGVELSMYWRIYNVAMDDDSPDWCDLDTIGKVKGANDIKLNDIPNPPTISFGTDAGVTDDTFKDCKYNGDSAILECPDFSTQCKTDMNESMGRKRCYGTPQMSHYVPKVWCAWE